MLQNSDEDDKQISRHREKYKRALFDSLTEVKKNKPMLHPNHKEEKKTKSKIHDEDEVSEKSTSFASVASSTIDRSKRDCLTLEKLLEHFDTKTQTTYAFSIVT